MSQFSNHRPEDLDACHFADQPYQPTEADWAEYGAYLDSLPADEFPEPPPVDWRDYNAWLEAQAADASTPNEAA